MKRWNSNKGDRGGYDSIPQLTASAYYKANAVAGLSLVTPPHLEIKPGEMVPNPFLVSDEKGVLVGVWVKKGATGYAPSGGIVTVWTEVHLDLRQYLLEDLVGKMGENGQDIFYVYPESLTPEQRAKGVLLPWDFGLAVWASLLNKDVRKALKSHVQRQKFAERIAVTICERNALAKHPAIASRKPDVTQEGTFYIYAKGWLQDTEDADALSRAVQEAEGGSDAPGVTATTERVEATFADVQGSAEESMAGDQSGTEVDADHKEAQAPADDALDILRSLWMKDRARFEAVRAEHFGAVTVPNMNSTQLHGLIDFLSTEG